MLIFTKAYISYRIILEYVPFFWFWSWFQKISELFFFGSRFLLCRKGSLGVPPRFPRKQFQTCMLQVSTCGKGMVKRWKHKKKTQQKSDSVSATSHLQRYDIRTLRWCLCLASLVHLLILFESTDFNMFTSKNLEFIFGNMRISEPACIFLSINYEVNHLKIKKQYSKLQKPQISYTIDRLPQKHTPSPAFLWEYSPIKTSPMYKVYIYIHSNGIYFISHHRKKQRN